MALTPFPIRVAALALAFAAAPVVASLGAAQGRSVEDTRTIESYRVTLPMLHKVLPAMYAPGARRCAKGPHRDPMSLSIAEMTRTMEACPPVVKSLRESAVQPRHAAVRDNALLLEQNDSEIRRLTKAGGQS